MSSPTQSVVSSDCETIRNSPTLCPLYSESLFTGFGASHHGLPVYTPEDDIKQEEGFTYYPAERKRKRDDSIANEINKKATASISFSDGSYRLDGQKLSDQSVLNLAKQGLKARLRKEEKNRKIQEEKRRVEEERQRIEEEKLRIRRVEEERRRVEEERQRVEEEMLRIERAKAELDRERSAILLNELEKFSSGVESYLGENRRLWEEESISGLFINTVEEGEDGIYMDLLGQGAIKVTATFTVYT